MEMTTVKYFTSSFHMYVGMPIQFFHSLEHSIQFRRYGTLHAKNMLLSGEI